MLERIIGVIKLDKAIYAQIKEDPSALTEALIIVLLTAASTAIGAMISGNDFLMTVIFAAINALLGWVLCAAVMTGIGKLLGGSLTMSEMLRLTGYAMTPMILSGIPCVGFIGAIWVFVTMFFAVYEALDSDVVRTIVAVVLGQICIWVLNFLLLMVFGISAVGVGMLTGLLGG